MKKTYTMLVFILFFIGSCASQSTTDATTLVQTTIETSTETQTSIEPTTKNEMTDIFTSELTQTPIQTTKIETSVVLESIFIDETTLLDTYEIDQFDIKDIRLILQFNQGFQSSLSLDTSMIVESLPGIIEPGFYTFNVVYLNQETSFTVQLVESVDIVNISIDMESYNPYALISTFDIGDVMLNIEYENERTEQIPLSFDMIDVVDMNKLFSEGYHDIQVQYQGFETHFNIAMIKDIPEENPLYNLETEAAVFYEVFDLLLENHYKEPSIGLLFEGATQGMIEILDDRFTLLFNQQEYSNFYGGLNENYIGTGIYPGIRDDFVIVAEVIENSPADLSGIQVDDIIHSINGNIVTTDNISDLYQLMVSTPALSIDIEIRRLGEDNLLSYTLQTVEIELESLHYEIIEENNQTIGLITITNFASQTDERFIETLNILEAQDIDGLIIDLRNNGGGYLDTVVNMLQVLLVKDSVPILTMDYPHRLNVYYGESQEKKPYDIITLVNENTASASEVFAAAMQEHGQYTIIGQTTYGKGIAQITRSLEVNPDLFLHITNAKWFTPLGNWIHFQGGSGGIEPDVKIQKSELERSMKVYLYHQDNLIYDSVSNDNIILQIILNGMGYTVRTDGYYDLNTKDAIEDIQANNGLTITGNVDDQTAIIINQWLTNYQNNYDSQLQEALNELME